MIIRVITLRYDETLGGFPEEALKLASGLGTIMASREHFFIHGGVPHLAVILEIDGLVEGIKREQPVKPDLSLGLPESLRPLYRNLRLWRNDKAKREGVPSYVLFRNSQLVEICRKLPRSQAQLKEIDGIGETTCQKYGEELLALIPGDLKVEISQPEENK